MISVCARQSVVTGPRKTARRRTQGRRAGARATQTTEAGPTSSPRVLVPIADGSEEIETVTVVDVLRRAGAEVVVASVEDRKECVCSRGVTITADVLVTEVTGRTAQGWDLIAIPGGIPGAERIADCVRLHSTLQKHFMAGKPMAAICAAPAVCLEPKGFLEGFAATAHPAFVSELGGSLEEKSDYAPARVLVDTQIITSRGPGTSLEWSLCLVERLFGKEKAAEVAAPMVVQPLNAKPLVPLEWRMDYFPANK
mmetsp:Transcript_21486/g.69502  ORF Transcript_21486/g.69502 Transcript_21486/m.69502 type:complete len:254 (-) Transcript_21486:61-822(-)